MFNIDGEVFFGSVEEKYFVILRAPFSGGSLYKVASLENFDTKIVFKDFLESDKDYLLRHKKQYSYNESDVKLIIKKYKRYLKKRSNSVIYPLSIKNFTRESFS